MISIVLHQFEHLIRYRIDFDGDILLFHDFHHSWMFDQSVAVANALGAEQYSINLRNGQTLISG